MKERMSEEHVFDEKTRKFGEIYERNYFNLYNYLLYRVGGNCSEAEDLTSVVVLKAFKSFREKEIKPIPEIEHPYGPWLFRIARNTLFNHYRDERKRKRTSSEIDRGKPFFQDPLLPEEEIIRKEKNKKLMEAIYQLSFHYQDLILFKLVNRFSNKEIGKIMNRSEGAIKSLFHRALVKLRKELEENPE